MIPRDESPFNWKRFLFMIAVYAALGVMLGLAFSGSMCD